jgi:hypothetical protein
MGSVILTYCGGLDYVVHAPRSRRHDEYCWRCVLAYVAQASPGWILSPLGLVALVLTAGGVALMYISFRRHGAAPIVAALTALVTALAVFGIVYGLASALREPRA